MSFNDLGKNTQQSKNQAAHAQGDAKNVANDDASSTGSRTNENATNAGNAQQLRMTQEDSAPDSQNSPAAEQRSNMEGKGKNSNSATDSETDEEDKAATQKSIAV